jgi:trimeric autotransporter adhesin
MTKRLTTILIALAVFVLIAVLPASALANGTFIQQGAFLFVGEQGLNVTPALNAAGAAPPAGNNIIAWWASAAPVYGAGGPGTPPGSPPSRVVDLGVNGRNYSFMVTSDFAANLGPWYVYDGTNVYLSPFAIADPSLDIRVWDPVQAGGTDVTGKSVPQGTKITFRIDTNMYSAADTTKRSNVIEAIGPPERFANNTPAGFVPVGATTNIELEAEYAAPYGTNWSNGTSAAAGTGTTVTYTNYSLWGPSVVWAPTYPGSPYVAPGGYVDPYNYANVVRHVFYYNTSVDVDNFYTSPPHLPGAVIAPNMELMGVGNTWVVGPGEFGVTPNMALDPTIDGFINIKVKPETGTTLQYLYNDSISGNLPAVYGPNSILKMFVNNQPFFWGSATPAPAGYFYWETGALDSTGQYAYPAGTYTVAAESALNKMKDNYKNAGADYTGKTVSEARTVTLVSDTVKIVANKDSVVRSKPFSVTVTGRPSTTYWVWVKNTRSFTGGYDDQTPLITLNQEKVYTDIDSPPGPSPIVRTNGTYTPENKVDPVYMDVAPAPFNGTRGYAQIMTSTSGTRTIEFETTNFTKAQTYTIRVERRDANLEIKSDEVDVKVEKGAVTITAAGDQSYYLGEEIKFSGTNTESYWTYLFIIGPNLPEYGAQIQKDDPRNWKVLDQIESTFKKISVMSDNTWSWKWGTSNVALDAGTYTIYALAAPRDKVPADISKTAYGTVSIIIKKPFVSATASQSTVAKGDKLFVTGTAEGKPGPGVAIWVLGKNKVLYATESVNADASFSYELTQDTTRDLASGQYFIVVQHPMQNDRFDIVRDGPFPPATDVWVKNLQLVTATNTARIFKIEGGGSLQGTDAAEALVQGINDPNVDDTYTKLQFLVEEPIIRIDAIGDRHVGDKFTITATTNLAVDDAVLFEVYSSSFKPTQKSQSGEFSGATGTVKVTKGDAGLNKLTFDVDASTFKPDEYIVRASAVIQDITGTALFNVLEGAAPTAVPTAVKTTAAPTGVATTAAPTAAATPTKTPTQPGFGALVALIGLGAVAFLVVRKH